MEGSPMQPLEGPSSAIWVAKACGIDIEALKSSLARTPTERLIRLEELLALSEGLARSRFQGRAPFPDAPSPAERRWVVG